MDFNAIIQNFTSPTVMFFFLGLIAVWVKSDLEIPPSIAKFFTIYLLFNIGIKGGAELAENGISSAVIYVMLACVFMAILVPLYTYKILRWKLDVYNAGAICAAFGSVSAVTFATSQSFLDGHNETFHGYMVAAMALMEAPAIIVGLLLINMQSKKGEVKSDSKHSMKEVIIEAFTNGSIVLLLGSMTIGYIAGHNVETDLHVFIKDIFKGILCLYLLDMGIVAGSRMSSLKNSGLFLVLFSIIIPIVNAALGIGISVILGLNHGDALLFTVLCASASYIAVPAAMRLAVPQANMSLLLPMSLAIAFPFNIIIGIPSFYGIIEILIK